MEEEKKKINHDILWKNVIRAYFRDFLALFMADLHKDIDWRRKIQFLDKEFFELFGEEKIGRRDADSLVKVYLKTGEEQWLFIHIEVQSYYDKLFHERMFEIYYRIRERHTKNIVAMAIFTIADRMPARLEEEKYGTRLLYEYVNCYIDEYKEQELLESKNPFSIVVLASFYALHNKVESDKLKLFRFKRELFRLLIERGKSLRSIRELFTFINLTINLSKPLQSKFEKEVRTMIDSYFTPIGPTESDKRIAKPVFEELTGLDFDEVMDKAERMEEAEKQAQQAEKQAQKQQEDGIVKLFNKGMSIKDIAEVFDVKSSKVKKILKTRKEIK